MADLVVVAFPSEEKAEEVRQKLLKMQQEYLIELEDAVIAVKKLVSRSAGAQPIRRHVRKSGAQPPAKHAT